MDVPRLLIWGVRGRICFMRRESWDRRDLSLVGPSNHFQFQIPSIVTAQRIQACIKFGGQSLLGRLEDMCDGYAYSILET